MSETLTLIGPTGSTAAVDSNALSVRPQSDFQKACEDGDAYSWSALTYDMTAKDTILGVENNSSTRDLYIQEIHIQSDTATQFIVHTETGLTMAGTNLVTGVNLNRNSGNAAPATAYDAETGNTAADAYTKRLITGLCAADGNVVLELDGCIVLPNDHFIGVDLTANAAACNVTIIGYFKDR
jgi:hypothetical protein